MPGRFYPQLYWGFARTQHLNFGLVHKSRPSRHQNRQVTPLQSRKVPTVSQVRFEGTAESCETLPVALRFRLQSNPLVAKLATKYVLPLGTRQVGDDVVFFNFGYEEDPPMALPLEPSDEPNRYCIQLYHQTASQVDLAGKKVLEVSCGAGGGASYIARNLGPAAYTGLDLNPASIELCRERHDVPGLDFVQGDAQNLPFPDESFDAVINVEASHQYPDFRGFLAEVARVLRPGGYFLYTDSRRPFAVADWDAALADAPLRQISERNIVDEAKRGLAANTQRSQERLSHRMPPFLVAGIRHAVRVLDWDLRRSGGISYRLYSFAKD
jgi:ubiquinone/menaquinone biosynthesis C-methylase UbiE